MRVTIFGTLAALFAPAVVLQMAAPAQAAPTSCESVFQAEDGGAKMAWGDRSFADEIKKMRGQLRDVQNGTLDANTLLASLTNRKISFTVKSGTMTAYEHGRLIGLSRIDSESGPDLAVVLTTKYHTSSFLLSNVDMRTIRLERPISTTDQKVTQARIEQAVQNNQFIRFLTPQGRDVIGRPSSLRAQNSGGTFNLTEKTGAQQQQSFENVIPESIQLFSVLPRQQTPAAAKLESQLRAAANSGDYVSFAPLKGDTSGKFEGWITGIETLLDGETLVRVSRANCEDKSVCFGENYRLAEIATDSFVGSPRLTIPPRDKKRTNFGDAPEIESFYQQQGQKGVVASIRRMIGLSSPSKNLIKTLAVFADADFVSGQTLPKELESLVKPDGELRLYFKTAESQIRVTIRRSKNGDWSFGNTAFDQLHANESDFNRTGYSLNEEHQLEGSGSRTTLPASELRYHLEQVRRTIVRQLVQRDYRYLRSIFRRTLFESYDSSAMNELLLKALNLRYDLADGMIDEEASLTPNQSKILAAIDYLDTHKQVFWSLNTRTSGSEPGIYSQKKPKPDSLYLMGYDLPKSLFEAMDAAGLQYDGTKWKKK